MMQRRMYANKERLKGFTGNFVRLDRERKSEWEGEESSNFFSLCLKSQQAYEASDGSDSDGERDGRYFVTQEPGNFEKPVAVNYGFQAGGKAAVRPVKLRKIENVPKYTTWIYLDRLYGNSKELFSCMVSEVQVL